MNCSSVLLSADFWGVVEVPAGEGSKDVEVRFPRWMYRRIDSTTDPSSAPSSRRSNCFSLAVILSESGWLRMRRDDPPTFEQVMESLALADLKKRNAAKLDAKNQEQLLEMGREVPGEIKPQEGEKPFWPKYEEYDEGDKLREHREGKDRWSDFKNPYATKDQGQSK